MNARRKILRRIGMYMAAVVYGLFLLVPIMWIVVSSFQPESALIGRTFDVKAKSWTLGNYTYIFTGQLPRTLSGELQTRVTQEVRLLPEALVNSLIISTGAALACLAAGLCAAYVFVFRKFRGKEGIFAYLLLTRLLPPITIVIPIYVIIQSVGLLGTRLGLILVYVSFILPLSILFYRSYLSKIPKEICEAALIDGCSEWRMALHIILPIAKGGILAGTLFSFFLAYVDFLFGLVLSRGTKTMPVVLGAMAGNPDLSYSMLCAGVTIAIIPSIIIGMIVRKYLVGGLFSYDKL